MLRSQSARLAFNVNPPIAGLFEVCSGRMPENSGALKLSAASCARVLLSCVMDVLVGTPEIRSYAINMFCSAT